MFASLTARTRPTLRRGLIAAAAASMVAGSVIVANVSEAAVVGTPTQIVGEQSNKCLSVEGNNTGNGGRSVIYDCDGGPSQSWTLTNAGELRVYSGGNVKCLDADGWGTAPGTRLVTWDCHGGANQKFTVNGDGSVRNQHNGLCLDVDAWGTGNNNPVILWSCHLGANQRWTQKTGNPPPPPPGNKAAPYLYLGWGNPPSATEVMRNTGIRTFTMAFILSGGGCTPAWDGNRPLRGGVDEQTINAIKAAGGSIIPSIGGWSGNKLGPNCANADALANAYIQVIDAYGLKAIDVDIENSDEFENEAVQDRILGAMKLVKERRPGTQTILTFGTTPTGPSWWGQRLVTRSKELGANIDIFTLMPFDFGVGVCANIAECTKSASQGLNTHLRNTFGWSEATAYQHQGISGMNGVSDHQEVTTLQQWTDIRDWAAQRHLARFAYWSVNRDRPCATGTLDSGCSGTSTPAWEFTKVTAGYNG